MPSRLEQKRYMVVLRKFAGVFCRKHHACSAHNGLCEQCDDLLRYARDRLSHCPHDPKPMCKDCETQCYRQPYKGQVRRIMKYGARYMVRHARVDVLLRGLKIG